MNARIKSLIAGRDGMAPDKVQALIDLLGGDELDVERLLSQATASEKAADRMGTRFKVVEPVKQQPTIKVYNPAKDTFAVLVGADQAQRGRAATKATPTAMKDLIEYSIIHWDGR